MILKASQRGGTAALSDHLFLTHDENEHIEVHSVEGFLTDDPQQAMQEIDAAARGTRSDRPFFSLQMSPPQDESVAPEVFEGALARIEKRLGLEGQPKIIVFHEKNGRRHAHAVYSRVKFNEQTGKAKMHDCGLYKRALNDIGRDLYIENGWQMPKGFQPGVPADPRNFTLAEWQQAKKLGEEPRLLKATIQAAWQQSDNRKSFEHALREKGFRLARGDRKGFVVVDYRMKPIGLRRALGVPTKEIEAKVGKVGTHQTIDQAKSDVAGAMTATLQGLIQRREKQFKLDKRPLDYERDRMTKRHREQRERFMTGVNRIEREGEQRRAARLPTGILGALFGFFTGRTFDIRRQNKAESEFDRNRISAMKQDFRKGQLDERLHLQERYVSLAKDHHHDRNQLRSDVDSYVRMNTPDRSDTLKGHLAELDEKRPKPNSPPAIDKQADLGVSEGGKGKKPDLDIS